MNNNTQRKQVIPIFQAIIAALLFGASAPFAKSLLGDIEPVSLAGFLYLGSGLILLIIKVVQKAIIKNIASEARLERADLGWLAGAILAGGIGAPIVQLFGLRSTPGATASLLLNFESVATTLIAALVFKEQVGRRALRAILLITLASILLSVNINQGWGFSIGSLGIIGACILWGIDNNFTRNISAKNPQSIVMFKGLIAGSFSLMLSLILGNKLPQIGIILKSLLLGSLSYGVSITLFIRAMRGLGASRTSALFATSPLAGIVLSFLLLHESPTIMILIAFPLMVLGTLFLVNEEHKHKHLHPAIFHEHSHRHDDEHHAHIHLEDQKNFQGKYHSHEHEHVGTEHEHEHMPDIHHRHLHPEN